MKDPRLLAALILMVFSLHLRGQEHTAVSLYLKKDPGNQLDSISSESGKLFHKLGHHGPAIENPWLAFRIYFDKRCSIDLYTKASPGPELREYGWYPSPDEQRAGSGADSYKVGKSLGLGGIRLWDGGRLLPLHPVSLRTARVVRDRDSSFIEMRSEGVSYHEKEVDVLVRLTVFPDRREARIQAISLSGEALQFATGINYFRDLEMEEGEGYIATWGRHPEDVAVVPTEVGAALIYQEETFYQKIDDGRQILLVSRPSRQVHTWISAASSRESEISTQSDFIQYLNNLSIWE